MALDVRVRRSQADVGGAVEAGAGGLTTEGETVAIGQGVGVPQGETARYDSAAEHVGAEADRFPAYIRLHFWLAAPLQVHRSSLVPLAVPLL